ncbi:MAG: YkgJ family cysteine cluster protein [Isosphaeraceae bacterium]
MPDANEQPWYRDGLQFACTRCGDCCTGAPGFVWVSAEEIGALAGHLGLTIDEFGRRFLRRVGDRISLIERPNGDCTFWDARRGCTVYPSRPVQCRTWPFWSENLATPQDWEETRSRCPGAGRGDWFGLDEIEAAARRTPP